MELTKEYFDQKFNSLSDTFATKEDLKAFATKDDLKEATKETKNDIREAVDELARILGHTFQEEHEYLEDRFSALAESVDVRERVYGMELKFRRLEDTFDLKL
jgi:iron-sulfur cluster repair protein YtfE (RIC family)